MSLSWCPCSLYFILSFSSSFIQLFDSTFTLIITWELILSNVKWKYLFKIRRFVIFNLFIFQLFSGRPQSLSWLHCVHLVSWFSWLAGGGGGKIVDFRQWNKGFIKIFWSGKHPSHISRLLIFLLDGRNVGEGWRTNLGLSGKFSQRCAGIEDWSDQATLLLLFLLNFLCRHRYGFFFQGLELLILKQTKSI